MTPPAAPDRAAVVAAIRHDALMSAAANGVINAGLNALMLRGKAPHLLGVDSIAARDHTVLGSAVTLALSLGLIVGGITFVGFRRRARAQGLAAPDLLARPFVPFGLRTVVTAAVEMAGLVVLAAVLWQRYAGSVSVPTWVAALVAGVVAALTAWHVVSRTARALLNPF